MLPSPGMEALLGYRSGTWTPQRLLEMAHPEEREAYRAAWVRFFKSSGKTAEFTVRSRRADRTYHWLRQQVVAERDAAGRVVRLTGTTEDVTPAMEQAAENRALLARRAASIAVLRAISASPRIRCRRSG